MFKKLIEWLTARSIQQIFNIVINEGIYAHKESEYTSELMCIALAFAHNRNLITKTEQLKAKAEIRRYIENDSLFLEKFLIMYGYFSSFPVRLSIYKDWDNRPKFKKLE